mmetsp:Transcript_7387/g.27024  ORF Transcript_7387/g.27024 Transcript_7387/m.27024 type:complete len:263 (+) Transcript_7387:2172-2960(+)
MTTHRCQSTWVNRTNLGSTPSGCASRGAWASPASRGRRAGRDKPRGLGGGRALLLQARPSAEQLGRLVCRGFLGATLSSEYIGVAPSRKCRARLRDDGALGLLPFGASGRCLFPHLRGEVARRRSERRTRPPVGGRIGWLSLWIPTKRTACCLRNMTFLPTTRRSALTSGTRLRSAERPSSARQPEHRRQATSRPTSPTSSLRSGATWTRTACWEEASRFCTGRGSCASLGSAGTRRRARPGTRRGGRCTVPCAAAATRPAI